MQVIDLSGPQGNAFFLMGLATDLCKELGKDPQPLLEEMRSDDYDHLVDVFEAEFIHLVKVIR